VKQYQTRVYQATDFAQWNSFVHQAKNATFLFLRDFMEYHQDRFEEYSLLVFYGEKLVAILPANRVGATVFSHQGLTYGGLVLNQKAKLSTVIPILKSVLAFLHQQNITTLNIKQIPSFYTSYFSEELDYCLFLLHAKTVRKDSLSVIDLTKEVAFSKDRKQCIRRGITASLQIKEEVNLESFWNEILIPNLHVKHQIKPVHSLEEMMQLQQKFPENIRHFNVYYGDKLVAGTTVFVTEKVAHPQYISGNESKNELGSLDYLYHHLITKVFADKNFFDFNNSNEENGTKINEGLLFWKESFGAKTVTQSFYEVATQNHQLLDTIWI
jgi:hypothetical protein